MNVSAAAEARKAGDRPRIGLLTARGSRLGGGVFEAVVAHAGLLREAGYEPVVFAAGDAFTRQDAGRFGDTPLVTRPPFGPAVFGWTPRLLGDILDRRIDLLHLHGIWQHASVIGAQWAAKTGRPYVISPHGMLDPWIVSRGRFKKRVAELAYERRSWAATSVFHALNAAEQQSILRQTGRAGAIVIPNAVQPDVAVWPDPAAPYILFLGRIHAKKNVDGLLEGWRLARDEIVGRGWNLRIAGWGDKPDVHALEEALRRQADETVQYVGPVFGEAKRRLVAGASFFALPSFSEGLPVAVLEAWAAGVPTLMSRGCNLDEGFARGAAINCGTEAGTIADALRRACTMDAATRSRMAAASRQIVEKGYSFDAVRCRWRRLYDELLGIGDEPV